MSLTINYKSPPPLPPTPNECIELWLTTTHLEKCPIKSPPDKTLVGGGSDFAVSDMTMHLKDFYFRVDNWSCITASRQTTNIFNQQKFI